MTGSIELIVSDEEKFDDLWFGLFRLERVVIRGDDAVVTTVSDSDIGKYLSLRRIDRLRICFFDRVVDVT